MNTTLYNKTFYFGNSVINDKYYLMQLVGYCGGIGICDLEWWKDKIDALVYNNIQEDTEIILKWIDRQESKKDRIKYLNRLNSAQKISVSQYLELIKTTPAAIYMKTTINNY